jgi:protein SCO1/2
MRCLCLTLALVASLHGESTLPRALEGVSIDEKLGAKVDPYYEFIGEDGHEVKLGKFLNQGRPVILNFVYYGCPMLCNRVLNGLTEVLREMPGTPGQDFEIVTVSIDPHETFDLARQKRQGQLASYGREASGWHFLTDRQGNVKRLAEQVGFNYRFDDHTQQYAHAAGFIVLTPDGTVSHYLYGVKYQKKDLELAFSDAAQSKTGSTIQRLLMFCFHYDPQADNYSVLATNVMRGGGALTVLILGTVLFRLWRRDLNMRMAR